MFFVPGSFDNSVGSFIKMSVVEKSDYKTFHCASSFVVYFTGSLVPLFLTALGFAKLHFKSLHFYCYTAAGKQAGEDIQKHCYEKYGPQDDERKFTIFAILLMLFLIVIGGISLAYSLYVKPRIDSTDIGERTFVLKVSTVYAIQLVFRLIILVAVLSLQCILYPPKLPTQVTCHKKNNNSQGLENRTTGVNATSSVPWQSYNCKNIVADCIIGFFVCVIIGVLALSVGEVVYLIRRVCKDSTFLTDEKFCADHLSRQKKGNPRAPERDVELAGR